MWLYFSQNDQTLWQCLSCSQILTSHHNQCNRFKILMCQQHMRWEALPNPHHHNWCCRTRRWWNHHHNPESCRSQGWWCRQSSGLLGPHTAAGSSLFQFLCWSEGQSSIKICCCHTSSQVKVKHTTMLLVHHKEDIFLGQTFPFCVSWAPFSRVMPSSDSKGKYNSGCPTPFQSEKSHVATKFSEMYRQPQWSCQWDIWSIHHPKMFHSCCQCSWTGTYSCKSWLHPDMFLHWDRDPGWDSHQCCSHIWYHWNLQCSCSQSQHGLLHRFHCWNMVQTGTVVLCHTVDPWSQAHTHRCRPHTLPHMCCFQHTCCWSIDLMIETFQLFS